MARINGPVWKVSRRLQFSILETGEEFAGKRPRTTAPGKAPDSRPAKLTNYGQQHREKQRIRFMYGVTERQFYNTFVKAQLAPGNTGHNFLFLLESRLDNVVYRMNIGRTRRAARQLVNHGHILVDGKRVDIPSYHVEVGQVISVREKSKNLVIIQAALEAVVGRPAFVSFDADKLEGSLTRFPERDELEPDIDETLVVEYYNQLL